MTVIARRSRPETRALRAADARVLVHLLELGNVTECLANLGSLEAMGWCRATPMRVMMLMACAACGKSVHGDAGTTTSSMDCEQVFAAPAHAELLCDEHVMGSGMEIHWRSYGSNEERGAVDLPYWRAATTCHYSVESKPPIFSVTGGGRRLETFDAPTSGPPTCAKVPGPSHRTVIVLSEKHDRP